MLGMGIYGFSKLLNAPQWYDYAMAVVGTPVGAGLILRQLVSYKTIVFGKKKLIVKYLVKRNTQNYTLQDMEYWKESIVKTGAGTYKETELKLTSKVKLTISQQEYSNYNNVMTYLRKNYFKKSI